MPHGALTRCLIGLGANLGNRRETLDAAAAWLQAHPEISEFRQSPCFLSTAIGGPADQPSFLNAAAMLQTALPARDLLHLLQTAETALGRTRGQRWAARTIDLDLLLYGEQVIATNELVVPHPRMIFRRFVLAPASTIAGDMIHSTTRYSIGELLQRLDRRPPYIALAGPAGGAAAEIASRVKEHYGPRVQLASDTSNEPRPTPEAVRAPPAQRTHTLKQLMHRNNFWKDQQFALLQRARSEAIQQECDCLLADFWLSQRMVDMDMAIGYEADFLPLEAASDTSADSQFLEPTLLVWLKPGAETSDDRNAGWRRGPPTCFLPTLVLSADDPELAQAEIAAAIAAINDRPQELPDPAAGPPLVDKPQPPDEPC